MKIRRGSNSQWISAYNIWCNAVFGLGDESVQTPCAVTECTIDPLTFTSHHQHDDQEIFLIKRGNGVMTIGDENENVGAGDAVFIPSKAVHSLKNISSNEPLEFFSLAWLAPQLNRTQNHTLIIPAPPTPNGPLHLGHLSGPYLAADVATRFYKMRGQRSLLFIGTDDHQCYIGNKARALDITNDNVLAKFKPAIREGFSRFLVEADLLIEPRNNHEYCEFIDHFFRVLVMKNAIVLRSAKTVFCNDKNQFVFGANVQGLCPHCNKPTLGHGCEACGHYNDNHDLRELRSTYGNTPVSIAMKERYYFPLNDYRDILQATLNACSMHPRLRSYYQTYLNHDLPDISASNFSNWGIDAPFVDGQKIYEWIEMAGAYAYYLKLAQQRFDINACRINLVEAFGFDNSFFYGFVVPALIHAYDDTLPKPTAFLSNYFYLLNHEKFSTSRNHAIWAIDFLSKFSADSVRLYLSLTRSENEPTNFDSHAFKSFLASTLIERWQNFFVAINDAIVTEQYEWPAVKRLLGHQERFMHDVRVRLWEIEEAFGTTLSLNNAASYLINCLDFINQYFQRHCHTKSDLSTNVSVVLSAVCSWAYALSPIMPQFGQGLLRSLGIEQSPLLSVRKSATNITLFDLQFFATCKQELAHFE